MRTSFSVFPSRESGDRFIFKTFRRSTLRREQGPCHARNSLRGKYFPLAWSSAVRNLSASSTSGGAAMVRARAEAMTAPAVLQGNGGRREEI